jgi:hypothetical protein
MANSGKKHIGGGAQGKSSGTGANTEAAGGGLGENDVLSNRDKAQHSRERGLDSKRVQTDPLRDTTANRGSEK